jgi:DHA2 family multidrug resistance protein
MSAQQQREYPPLSGMALVLGATVLSLANFMVVLDTSIANVAMPTIAGDLGVSTTEGTWVVTSYAVAEAITIPLTGWLVRRFGQVRLFLFSVIFFVIFSVLCGMANSLGMLVLFRVLQGLAGGPLIPLSSTLMLTVFPKAKANIALSLWGMMTVVAPILGPILGGVISDNWAWSWAFYINVGFGLVVGLIGWHLLKNRETKTERTRIDAPGLVFLILFVSSFQIMIDKGRELDWFSSPVIVWSSIVAAVSLVLLIVWELTDKNPVLDLSVFASRSWFVSTVTLCLMFGIFFGNIVLTPLWLQQQMGYTATWAGYATAPMGVLAVLTSPMVGKLLPKVDPRWIVTFGLGVLGLSFFMRAHLNTQISFWNVAFPMLVLGGGVPACIITLTSLGVSDLPPSKVANGAGLQNFLRVMSMAVGASLTQTFWEHFSKSDRSELVAIVTPHGQAESIANAVQHGVSASAAPTMFSNMVEGQAVMLATNDFYAVATLVILLPIGIVWFIRPPKGPMKVVSGH